MSALAASTSALMERLPKIQDATAETGSAGARRKAVIRLLANRSGPRALARDADQNKSDRSSFFFGGGGGGGATAAPAFGAPVMPSCQTLL